MYNRLPYGVNCAPGIFQRVIEQVIHGIPFTAVYLDDIVVSGATITEHKTNLKLLLDRLSKTGLRLKREKCDFMKNSIIFLGHIIDSKGIRPTDNKIEAITNAPAPVNIQQLRSYLGSLNYYHRFLPNLSSLLSPLHQPLRNDSRWQ